MRAIGIALASVVAAPAGAALAHRMRGVALKRVFAAFLLAMGLSVLASVLRQAMAAAIASAHWGGVGRVPGLGVPHEILRCDAVFRRLRPS